MALPFSSILESWTFMSSGIPSGRHSLPAFMKGPTSSLFLAVNGDGRLRSPLEGEGALVDVQELCIAVRVDDLLAFFHPPPLEAVSRPAEHLKDHPRADGAGRHRVDQ